MDISRQILSDIVVYNKYAKYLPDLQRRETWQEICDRNMQMHIRKYPQLTNEIESIYKDFVLPKRVLPSMRSAQFGGPAIEINNARIFNCFGEETKFITSEGLRCFRDFKHGDEIIVKTHNNNWKKAVVKNYGKQKLNTLTFRKFSSKKTVRVTENHRWILKDGTETCDIKIGDGLFKVNWFGDFNYEDSTIEEKIMWVYGYVYGDGSLIKNKNGVYQHSMVRLCGHKIKYVDRFTELGFKNSSPKSIGSDIMIYTGTYLKTLPNIIEEPNYLIRAFVRGYLDADGDTTRYNLDRQEGTSLFRGMQITKDSETINYIIDLLSVSGFFITGIDDYTGQETNYGIRPNTKRIRGFTSFGDSPNSLWYLREIEKNHNEEDVWCLEVEDDHSFILDGGLVTGNCCATAIDDYRAFPEICFLLLSGCGVGYSVQKHHVNKLPEIKQPIKTRKFLIEDSIMGWADAVKALCKAYFFGERLPLYDFRDIRPKGALLVTSGGKAPGPEPLKDMLHNIKKIFDRKLIGEKLTSIECHDIACYIAQAVLAGGVRRSATISLFNIDDQDMLASKHGNWWELNSQRALANNSAVLVRHKITKDDFMSVWTKTKESGSGEPGVFFTNEKNILSNPCVEISLNGNGQMCNLTEINGSAIHTQDDFNNAAIAAAFIGTLQAGYTDFHYLREIWRETTEKDALLGVSITGLADKALLKLNFKEAAEYAVKTNAAIAKKIGINKAARVNCIKPSGSTSIVLGTSSGIHAWFAPYYIRRIRLGKDEAIYKYLKKHLPDLVEDEFHKPDIQAVLSIPQKAPDGAIYRNESPIDLLERVKKIKQEWILPGHRKGSNHNNVSVTVSVKDDEWDLVGEWMWANRDVYNGVSVLPYDGGTYKQAPFEEITESEYSRLIDLLKQIDLTKIKETQDETTLQGEAACAGGACEII
jgi:ribonucleoside-triphosphate reductase